MFEAISHNTFPKMIDFRLFPPSTSFYVPVGTFCLEMKITNKLLVNSNICQCANGVGQHIPNSHVPANIEFKVREREESLDTSTGALLKKLNFKLYTLCIRRQTCYFPNFVEPVPSSFEFEWYVPHQLSQSYMKECPTSNESTMKVENRNFIQTQFFHPQE